MEILENKKKELEKKAQENAELQSKLQQELNEVTTEMVRLQGAYREIESIIKELKENESHDVKKPE